MHLQDAQSEAIEAKSKEGALKQLLAEKDSRIRELVDRAGRAAFAKDEDRLVIQKHKHEADSHLQDCLVGAVSVLSGAVGSLDEAFPDSDDKVTILKEKDAALSTLRKSLNEDLAGTEVNLTRDLDKVAHRKRAEENDRTEAAAKLATSEEKLQAQHIKLNSLHERLVGAEEQAAERLQESHHTVEIKAKWLMTGLQNEKDKLMHLFAGANLDLEHQDDKLMDGPIEDTNTMVALLQELHEAAARDGAGMHALREEVDRAQDDLETLTHKTQELRLEHDNANESVARSTHIIEDYAEGVKHLDFGI